MPNTFGFYLDEETEMTLWAEYLNGELTEDKLDEVYDPEEEWLDDDDLPF